MPTNSADQSELAHIRRLASEPAKIEVAETVKYDLMGQGLTNEVICEQIVTWIDSGQRVKKVILRGKHVDQPAFEMKPRINDLLFYVKVTLCELGDPEEYLLVISAHPDH